MMRWSWIAGAGLLAIAGSAPALASGVGLTTVSFDAAAPFGVAVQVGTDLGVTVGCSAPVGSYNFITAGRDCGFATGANAATVSQTGNGASATASADRASGLLSVSVTGQDWVPYVGNAGAAANAVIWDTVIFAGAAAGASAHLEMSGTATLSGADTTAGYSITLIDLSVVTRTPAYLLTGNLSQPAADGSYDYAVDVPIVNGDPYLLAIALHAQAATVDAFGTAAIDDLWSLSVPEGVTYTLASEIPEPATPALMAGWLVALAGMMIPLRRSGARAPRARNR